jgi:hypothetical protein
MGHPKFSNIINSNKSGQYMGHVIARGLIFMILPEYVSVRGILMMGHPVYEGHFLMDTACLYFSIRTFIGLLKLYMI